MAGAEKHRQRSRRSYRTRIPAGIFRYHPPAEGFRIGGGLFGKFRNWLF